MLIKGCKYFMLVELVICMFVCAIVCCLLLFVVCCCCCRCLFGLNTSVIVSLLSCLMNDWYIMYVFPSAKIECRSFLFWFVFGVLCRGSQYVRYMWTEALWLAFSPNFDFLCSDCISFIFLGTLSSSKMQVHQHVQSKSTTTKAVFLEFQKFEKPQIPKNIVLRTMYLVEFPCNQTSKLNI